MWGVGLAPGKKQNENDLLHRVEGGDPVIVIRKEEDGVKVVGLHWNGCKEKGIMTPPSSPENGPEDKKAYQSQPQPHCNLYGPYERGDGQRSFKADLAGGHPGTNLDLPERVVLLYVGRM